jgi:hypothetical protein
MAAIYARPMPGFFISGSMMGHIAANEGYIFCNFALPHLKNCMQK